MKKAALIVILIFAFASPTLAAGWAHADDIQTTLSREPASAKHAKRKKDHVAKQIDAAFPAVAPTPAYTPPPPPREFDREVDMSPAPSQTHGFGIQLQLYYDPLSIYERFYPSGTQGIYSYQNNTGLVGMQLLFARINRHHFEFTSGVDYMFTENVQTQQSAAVGNYLVNSQTLSVMGVKILQIGYRFGAGPFTIVPYTGLGVYYGRNSVTIANLGFANATDAVTYSKLLGTWVAGGRMDFDFNKSRTFSAGVALEMFVPFKIADSLAQSGTTQTVQAGDEPALQSSLDFMTSVAGRVMGTVAVYF